MSAADCAIHKVNTAPTHRDLRMCSGLSSVSRASRDPVGCCHGSCASCLVFRVVGAWARGVAPGIQPQSSEPVKVQEELKVVEASQFGDEALHATCARWVGAHP